MKSSIVRILTLLTLVAIAVTASVVFAEDITTGLKRIGAGIAFGLAACGAGIGVGLAGAAAIGAIVERRELFAMYLLFIALAEAIAIYGFAMAFILM